MLFFYVFFTYDKSGNLNPVYSPLINGNAHALLILVTAQNGRTT